MATVQVVAVKDRATQTFEKPWFVLHLNQAIRHFTDGINQKDTAMNAHPDDYDLWSLGTWDDATGKFNSIEPTQIAVGKNMVRQ